MNDFLFQLSFSTLAFFLNYLLHSTVILTGTRGLFAWLSWSHPRYAQFGWRFAILAGLFTAFVSTALMKAQPTGSKTASNSVKLESTSAMHPRELHDSDKRTRELKPFDFSSQQFGEEGHSVDPTQSGGAILTPESNVDSVRASANALSDTNADAKNIVNVEATSIADDELSAGNKFESSNGKSDRNFLSALSIALPQGNYIKPIALVFVLMIVVGGARTMFCLLKLHFTAKSFQLLDSPGIQELIEQLQLKRNLRGKFRLMQSDAISQPMAIGFLNRRIVLPIGIEQSLREEELNAMLAHELAHLVRGDYWWLWIGKLICSIFWIQPLNRMAFRKWLSASEELCDHWAVESGVKPIVLAKCLTAVAEKQMGSDLKDVALAATGSASQIVLRVERLLNGNQPQISRRRIGSITIACIGFLLLPVWLPGIRLIQATVVAGELVETASSNRPLLLPSLSAVVETNAIKALARSTSPDLASSLLNSGQTAEIANRSDAQVSDSLENAWRSLEKELAEVNALLETLKSKLPNASPQLISLVENLNRQQVSLAERRSQMLVEVRSLLSQNLNQEISKFANGEQNESQK